MTNIIGVKDQETAHEIKRRFISYGLRVTLQRKNRIDFEIIIRGPGIEFIMIPNESGKERERLMHPGSSKRSPF